MSKDPAVLWYTSDFLTGTSHFKDEELGFYTRLLAYQHQKGSLSLDFIKRSCKGNFEKKWEVIKTKFVETTEGLFYNERMEIETLKRKKSSLAQSERVKKRWGKLYHGNTTVIQNTGNTFLENENENENEIINDDNKKNKCEKKERKKRTKKTIFPSKIEIESMLMPEEELESCKKLFDNILGKEGTTENDIMQYWQRFKIINFTGEKPYKTNKEIYNHFKNWLNFQIDKKIKNNNGKYPTNTTTSDRKQQQYDQNNELLRAYEDFTKQSFG